MVTLVELARLLGMSPQKVKRLVAQGVLPRPKVIGRIHVWDWLDLQAVGIDPERAPYLRVSEAARLLGISSAKLREKLPAEVLRLGDEVRVPLGVLGQIE